MRSCGAAAAAAAAHSHRYAAHTVRSHITAAAHTAMRARSRACLNSPSHNSSRHGEQQPIGTRRRAAGQHLLPAVQALHVCAVAEVLGCRPGAGEVRQGMEHKRPMRLIGSWPATAGRCGAHGSGPTIRAAWPGASAALPLLVCVQRGGRHCHISCIYAAPHAACISGCTTPLPPPPAASRRRLPIFFQFLAPCCCTRRRSRSSCGGKGRAALSCCLERGVAPARRPPRRRRRCRRQLPCVGRIAGPRHAPPAWSSLPGRSAALWSAPGCSRGTVQAGLSARPRSEAAIAAGPIASAL